ncbi:MAG: T9SS type A sorting domain-containing protein [Chitinispirillaceae bacterium]|nr:T9SS type A sorting domain-containing protein [Chitinispirillaceae bacterium]
MKSSFCSSFQAHRLVSGALIVIVSIALSVKAQEEPQLVAHWSFDSSSGNTTFYDVTGNGFDATCSKTLGTADGIEGEALVSNVTGYSFNVADSKDAFSMPEFSLEALVKLNAVTGANYIVLSHQSYPGAADDGGYALEINEYGKVRFTIVAQGGGSWIYCEGTTTLKAGGWYHLAATYDGTTMSTYLNGILEKVVSRPGGYAPSKKDASIGCQENISGVSRNWINGMIDELMVFNYALSADSIAAHFSAYDIPEPPEPEPHLIAHWSFDANDGIASYTDVTGNGYNTTGTPVSLATGVAGKALDCKDSAFSITILKSSENFNLANLTIEAWIYSYIDLVNPGSFYNMKSIFEFTRCGMEGSGIASGYAMKISDAGRPIGVISMPNGGGWQVCEGSDVLLPRKWYHMATTYDGTDIKLYINGVMVKKLAAPEGYLAQLIPARIGAQFQVTDPANNTGRLRQRFNGKIDELKLYNYSLDAQTLKSIYEALKPPEEPPFEINLGMKTTYARAGDTVVMPVYLANHEEFSISAVQLTLEYDPDQLTLLSISNDSGLVRKWELFDWNNTTAGSIPVAMAGIETKLAYGEGELIRSLFVVANSVDEGDTCMITLNDVDIDEKNDLVITTVQNGRVIISQDTILYGDVTGNKEVNIVDAQAVLRYVVGALQLPDSCCPNFTIAVADVSGNGTITSYDAALIFQYGLGLIPAFPVEPVSSRPLAKQMAPTTGEARFSFTMVGSSKSEVTYDLVGTNLLGFYAGEFAIACNAPEEILSRSTITTEVRGATFSSRFSAGDNLLKVAVSTNDDIDHDDPVTIVRIVLPPSEQTAPEFTIRTALINEGAILTEYENNGLVGLLPTTIDRAPLRPSIRFFNNLLTIRSSGSGPASLTIWDLNGRKIARHTAAAGLQTTFDLSRYGRGTYIFRLQEGGKTTGGRFMLINR